MNGELVNCVGGCREVRRECADAGSVRAWTRTEALSYKNIVEKLRKTAERVVAWQQQSLQRSTEVSQVTRTGS